MRYCNIIGHNRPCGSHKWEGDWVAVDQGFCQDARWLSGVGCFRSDCSCDIRDK